MWYAGEHTTCVQCPRRPAEGFRSVWSWSDRQVWAARHRFSGRAQWDLFGPVIRGVTCSNRLLLPRTYWLGSCSVYGRTIICLSLKDIGVASSFVSLLIKNNNIHLHRGFLNTALHFSRMHSCWVMCLVFFFKEIAKLLSKASSPFNTSTRAVWMTQCLCPHQLLALPLLKNLGHSDMCEGISHYGFNLHFSNG